MRKAIYIGLGVLTLNSCKEDGRLENANISTPRFTLTTGLFDFKQKMTELDTLIISFDHSVCTYQGYETLEITKQSDSLRIVSHFYEMTFEENPRWEKVYEVQITNKDTSWGLEDFLKRNDSLTNFEKGQSATLIVTDKKDTIRYYTRGLLELNRFIEDYYQTMRKLQSKKSIEIYGVEVAEE